MTKYFNKNLIVRLGIVSFALFVTLKVLIFTGIFAWMNGSDTDVLNKFFLFYAIYIGVLSLFLGVAIWLISKMKPAGIRLMQVVCLLFYLDAFKNAGLMSWHSVVGILAIVTSVLSFLVILICATKKIKKEFNFKTGWDDKYPVGKTVRRVILGVLIGLLIGLFCAYLFHYYYVYPQKEVYLSAQSAQSQSYEILNCSFDALMPLQVSRVINNFPGPHDFRSVFLQSEESGLRLGINVDPSDFVAKMFYYENSYDFHRRLLRLMRFVSEFAFVPDPFDVIEVEVNGKWEGFLMHFDFEEGNEVYQCVLYDKQNRNRSGSLGIVFERKQEGNKDVLKQMLGSFELIDNRQMDAEGYFKQALSLLEKGQVEKAQESLINALDQDWSNPEYHYQLAKVFMESGNYVAAKASLDNLIDKSPNYKDALQLSDEVDRQLGD